MKTYTRCILSMIVLGTCLFVGCDSSSVNFSERKTASGFVQYIKEHSSLALRNTLHIDTDWLYTVNMVTGYDISLYGQCYTEECDHIYVVNGEGDDITSRLEEANFTVNPGASIMIYKDTVLYYGTLCHNDVLLMLVPQHSEYTFIQRLFQDYCNYNDPARHNMITN